VKDSRVGELLWKEWTGCGYEPLHEDSVTFFTEDHVDLENELIRRALASALQRDGVSISLGNGFKYLESAVINYGYAGEIDSDTDFTACDEDGETREGEIVDHTLPITWVEVMAE
jgi:hypothetical protein